MDINTPKGEISRQHEAEVARRIEKAWPTKRYIITPDPVAFDALIVDAEHGLVGIAETKCRDMEFEELRSREFEWLVTFDKLLRCKAAAEVNGVPLWGFLGLMPSRKLLVAKLFTPGEGWHVRFRVEKTETQATTNGGKALRDNAYIDMSRAAVLDLDEA